jgi:hypothetical protein
MSKPNCGCNNSGSSDGDYMLVKATASQASSCGVPGEATGTESCDKQEPMYDVCLSDFLLPSVNGSTSMEVCNASIYSLSMWLQFTNPVATLQIVNITGNILSLVNRCPNGEIVDENPIIGTVVTRGTSFVVVGEPQCFSDEEDAERVNNALKNATELCIPNMETSSSTATVRPIGKIESDTADLGAKKCIKAIFGILFKSGTPILSALRLEAPIDLNYRRIAKHKTNNEVVHLKNYSETPGITDESYALMVNKNREAIVPSYFTHLFTQTIDENSTAYTSPSTWPSLGSGGSHEENYNISSMTGNVAWLQSDRNHIIVMVRIDVTTFVNSEGARSINVLLNNISVGKVMNVGNGTGENINGMSISVPIKVLKSGYNLNLKLNATGNSQRYHYRVSIDGIFY